MYLCRGLENTVCSELHNLSGGLSEEEQNERQSNYGSNVIEIHVKPILHLVVYEVRNIFMGSRKDKKLLLYISFEEQTVKICSLFPAGTASILHFSNVHNNCVVLTTLLAVYSGSVADVYGIHRSNSVGNKKGKGSTPACKEVETEQSAQPLHEDLFCMVFVWSTLKFEMELADSSFDLINFFSVALHKLFVQKALVSSVSQMSSLFVFKSKV